MFIIRFIAVVVGLVISSSALADNHLLPVPDIGEEAFLAHADEED